MPSKIQVYKLVTPFGASLHETDEVDGKLFIPSTIFKRCWFWRLINCNVQVLRLGEGKWASIFNWPARKLRQRII